MGLLAGLARFSPDAPALVADEERVRVMCEAMRHRCDAIEPSVARGSGAALGMGSVMCSVMGSVMCGDIASRDVIVAADAPLHSADDIAAGYKTRGESVFAALRGPFAIAIWDRRERTLLLARDRAGAKPLHYATAGDRLVFASEIKALLVNPEIDRRVDVASLDHYLAFLLTPRDRSIFRGVQKLLPAHYLKLRNGSISLHQYWHLPLDATFRGSEDDAVAELDARLRSAVGQDTGRRPERQATPGVVLLSGGVNSSLLAALVATTTDERPTTIAVRFTGADGKDVNGADVDSARAVARHLDAEHHELSVTPDALQVIDRIAWHFDEPFADASAIPMWYLAEAVGSHTSAAITGDGDEIFGACDRYLPPGRVAAFDRAAGRAGRLLAGVGARFLPDGAQGRDFLRHVALDDRQRYLDAMRVFRPEDRTSLLDGDLARSIEEESAEARFGGAFDELTRLPWPAQMMAFDFLVELPEDVLAKRDRTSMAHALECHSPLLDHEVVELVASLPVPMKIGNGRLKHALRTVASRYLPPAIVDRPKQGFGLSPAPWIRGSLRDAFGDVLGSALTRQRGYFNQATVARLLRDHASGARDRTQQLWQLLVFELWHRQHVDRPALAA